MSAEGLSRWAQPERILLKQFVEQENTLFIRGELRAGMRYDLEQFTAGRAIHFDTGFRNPEESALWITGRDRF